MIPLIGVLILLVCPTWPIGKWQGAKNSEEIKQNWIKFMVYAVVNLIACIMIAALSWEGAVAKTKFNEVWNLRVTGIRHEMEWTTHETYTTTTKCGKSTITTVHHYTKHHGPFWYRTDEYGQENEISESQYNQWRAQWHGEAKTGMNKGTSAGFSDSIDGPIYSCNWPKTFETIWPDVEVHKYVNKIRVSNSVLKWGQATEQQMAKYPRPVDQGNTTPVVIYGGLKLSGDEILYLKRVSASLGRMNLVHPMLVVFDKDVGQGVVEDVLTAWQGPNKNELITFMALDGTKIKWVEVHSWMDNTTLHATLRDEMAGKPFSVQRYGELLRVDIPKLWLKMDFRSINDYLQVDINPWWFVLGFVLAIIFGIGSYFVIEHFMPDESKTWGDDPEFWRYREDLTKRYGRRH